MAATISTASRSLLALLELSQTMLLQKANSLANLFFFFFLAAQCDMWGLRSPTRNGTCSGSMESQPLDLWGSPHLQILYKPSLRSQGHPKFYCFSFSKMLSSCSQQRLKLIPILLLSPNKNFSSFPPQPLSNSTRPDLITLIG